MAVASPLSDSQSSVFGTTPRTDHLHENTPFATHEDKIPCIKDSEGDANSKTRNNHRGDLSATHTRRLASHDHPVHRSGNKQHPRTEKTSNQRHHGNQDRATVHDSHPVAFDSYPTLHTALTTEAVCRRGIFQEPLACQGGDVVHPAREVRQTLKTSREHCTMTYPY